MASVQYASVSLSKAQQNYTITELECLAVAWTITKVRHYLTLRPFQLITDHSALQYILTDKGNVRTGRLACWKLLLQEYPYEIVYRPDQDNVFLDALSRNTLPPCLHRVSPRTMSPKNSDFGHRSLTRSLFDSAAERLAFLAAVEPEAITPVVWKREQAEDPFCIELIARVTAKRRKAVKLSPEYADLNLRTVENCVFDNGILYHFVMTTSSRQCHKHTAVRPGVAPVTLRAAIMAEAHDNEFGGGHLGQRATYVKLQQRCYWPTTAKDLIEYLKRCRVCAKHNTAIEKTSFVEHNVPSSSPLGSSGNLR